MKKEFTIDDFTKSDWYKSIEEIGTWSTFSNKWDINYSSILTELIYNAGRWCERFASDLFISWKTVENYLENKKDNSPESKSFLFGFRQSGVDHDTFILSRFNQNEYTEEYRTIYRLDIEFTIDEKNDYFGFDPKFKMTLYRVK